MREVVLKIHCDLCSHEVSEEAASNVQLTIEPGRGTYEIDLCPGCLDDYLSEARQVKSTRSSSVFTCDVCRFAAKSQGGLELHKTRKHGGSA